MNRQQNNSIMFAVMGLMALFLFVVWNSNDASKKAETWTASKPAAPITVAGVDHAQDANMICTPASPGFDDLPLVKLLRSMGYSTDLPSRQRGFDLLAPWFTSWRNTPEGEPVSAGTASLSNDGRIRFAISNMDKNQFPKMTVLELGPLEGGHSLMLQDAGFKQITAIEGNPLAYLKCLLIKETYNLDRVKFLFGDFTKYLTHAVEHNVRYDFLVAIGVLYHMVEPVQVLYDISRISNTVMVWTHFYDARYPNTYTWLPNPQPITVHGYTHKPHCHEYNSRKANFIGGTMLSACWLEHEDIIGALRHFGFKRFKFMHEPDYGHHHGPNTAFIAFKD